MNHEGPIFYARALKRIRLLTILIAAAGAVAWASLQNPRAAVGFLAGAALSVLNFRVLETIADALGSTKRPGAIAALFIVLRYAFIGCALYVIVKILGFAPLPVFAGLLAAFGAVLLEILYELISA
jgi:ATP synthase I chain